MPLRYLRSGSANWRGEHVTVALSGDGADEAFAGYRRQTFHHREEQVRARYPACRAAPPRAWRARVRSIPSWTGHRGPCGPRPRLLSLAASGEEGYARALSVTGPELRSSLYSSEFQRLRGDYRAEQPFIDLMRGAPARSGLDRAQYADLKFYLPG